MGGKVICDGVLCSILHAMSGSASPNREEFMSVIERECDENELTVAWKKLFTHFNEAICDTEKKPIIDIVRRTTKKIIRDIVEQLIKVDKTVSSQLFFMPWDFELKSFEGDSVERARLIKEQMASEMDTRIDALENKMEEKNKALVELIQAKFSEMMEHKSNPGLSYAAATSRGASSDTQGGTNGSVGGGVLGAGARSAGGGGGTSGTWSELGHERSRHGGGLRPVDSRDRSRSSSKRRRGENGEIIEVDDQPHHHGDRVKGQAQSRAKKFVVGTTSSAQSGRKMRSPPADIFVYGVHPATTKEDIVQDLAESGIVITEQCIIKKSRDEAPLNSYKISVRAEDLNLALDPSVWPLRVKVREFIHYSKKNSRQGDYHGAREQQGQAGSGGGSQPSHGHGQARGQYNIQHQPAQKTVPNIVTPNMYDALQDDDNGACGVGDQNSM